ncbi:NUDIX domain-containing protein [Candidatus Dojkabacteria bacterium]|nr:NUDIX domain-containing protein [Candidatus Dojkabacteria bacterium]
MASEVIYGVLGITYSTNTGKFLLLKHRNGFWTFPGGAREIEDETIESTLMRELREEIGLGPDQYLMIKTPIKNEFTYGQEKPNRMGKTGITHLFLVKVHPKTKPRLRNEIIETKWVEKRKVFQMVEFPDIQRMFMKSLELITASK